MWLTNPEFNSLFITSSFGTIMRLFGAVSGRPTPINVVLCWYKKSLLFQVLLSQMDQKNCYLKESSGTSKVHKTKVQQWCGSHSHSCCYNSKFFYQYIMLSQFHFSVKAYGTKLTKGFVAVGYVSMS